MQQHLGHKVKCLNWQIRHAMDTAMESIGLTGPQSFLLRYISRQETPPCIRDVEEILGFTHATVCGILRRLEDKEFIALRQDETDRRIKRLYLLPRGQDCLQRTGQAIDGVEAQMARGFSPEEWELFRRFLDRANENLDGSKGCRNNEEESKA